jgi:FSR family fosmidomycin resistance protein-like MFS transporter
VNEPGLQPAAAHGDVRANPTLIGILALGHLVVDMTQGSFPAILPLLRSTLGLSYTTAGLLMLVSTVTSSIVQPVFGYYADRRSRTWMLSAALLCAGVGLALLGFARSYGGVLALLVVMSLGVAAYHPQGFKTASGVAGSRKATALSWFSLGGNVGIALGPPFITTVVTELGLYGTAAIMAPVVLMVLILLRSRPRLAAVSASAHDGPAGRAHHRPAAFALLMTVVMIRSWTQLGFVTYLPFYYVDHLKLPPKVVGPLLFVFLGAGALGTVLAGPLADRGGVRKFTVLAMLGAVPLGVAFLMSGGTASWILLALYGSVLVSTFSITVVLGQQYLPGNAGLASGLIVGFAIGTGGLGVALLGWAADHFGLTLVLWISALLPVAGFAAAVFLPRDERIKPADHCAPPGAAAH